MADFFAFLGRYVKKMKFIFFTVVLLLITPGLSAAPETNAPPVLSRTIITNLDQFWSLPPEQKNQLHRIQMELLIYYCQPAWSVFWGNSDGLDAFLPLRGLPISLKAGEKIFIDGQVLPVNQEFLWDRTAVKILSESNEIKSVSAKGKLLDASSLDKHFVEVEALVDSQELVTSNVLLLNLLAENFNFTAFVMLDVSNQPQPQLTGQFIRIKGVYTETFDAFGKIADIKLWSPGLRYIETVNALGNDPRFSVPITSSEKFAGADPNALVHVMGTVRSQQPGQAVTIWDDTGQIRILTKQRYPLRFGDRIEAVGRPTLQGLDRVLESGLFRLAAADAIKNSSISTNQARLHLADQVRALDQESVLQRPPVSLVGLVTWVDSRKNYILDSSGGICVMRSRLQNGRRIQIGMLVRVDGVAVTGAFAPVITNAVIRQTGTMPLPDAPQIGLEQALTGTKDGCWIQMRGYVRRVSVERSDIKLQLVAPGGEFTARVPKLDSLKTLQGSVVLVQGVCVVVANSRRQLTGIELWSPEEADVQIEQSAPENVFALPQRSIASLRQFSLFNSLNERVYTRGTVTLQVLGRYFYLQDGDNSVLALSEQTEPLRPGDQVEVVGFSGNDSGNFVLREAVYRRIAPGPEPVPAQLPALQSVSEGLDGLLVRAEGTLLDRVQKSGETHLTIQASGLLFEAKLDKTNAFAGKGPELGSKLAVTGVYRVQRDEYGNPRSFLLNLRDGSDVRVLAPPPWWTLRRLLLALAGVVLVFLFALLWTAETQRKNSLLLQAQLQLKAAHDILEERVRERTRELREEVVAKERAHKKLSEAQQRLLIASRQAGMAEVATGILHNIGNVLNSVNVSASLIGDSLSQLRIEKLSKVAVLLNEQGGDLPKFLTEDPRGRVLPGYLQDLANTMTESERNLREEIQSLIKQVDHIKTIVAMQQNYARIGGCMENLDPVEVMEDAVQINRAAYERHGIELVREYEETPRVFADRHKTLQILINLLSNAKYASKETSSKTKRVILRLGIEGGDRVRFEVSDTGIGIAPENLERIFTLGFTTKPNGHGFGLHSGANAAKEMDGRLFALSEGVGRGAAFVLELPAAEKLQHETNVEVETA